MSGKNIPEDYRFKYLGQFLKELRFNNGLTQQQVSENVGLHRNTIIHIECGNNLTVLSLMKLADFYEIDFGELLQID